MVNDLSVLSHVTAHMSASLALTFVRHKLVRGVDVLTSGCEGVRV